MGRPKGSVNENFEIETGLKDQFIKLRVSAEQKALINELAEMHRESVTKLFLRSLQRRMFTESIHVRTRDFDFERLRMFEDKFHGPKR